MKHLKKVTTNLFLTLLILKCDVVQAAQQTIDNTIYPLKSDASEFQLNYPYLSGTNSQTLTTTSYYESFFNCQWGAYFKTIDQGEENRLFEEFRPLYFIENLSTNYIETRNRYLDAISSDQTKTSIDALKNDAQNQPQPIDKENFVQNHIQPLLNQFNNSNTEPSNLFILFMRGFLEYDHGFLQNNPNLQDKALYKIAVACDGLVLPAIQMMQNIDLFRIYRPLTWKMGSASSRIEKSLDGKLEVLKKNIALLITDLPGTLDLFIKTQFFNSLISQTLWNQKDSSVTRFDSDTFAYKLKKSIYQFYHDPKFLVESEFDRLMQDSYVAIRCLYSSISLSKAWGIQNIMAPLLLFSSLYQLSFSNNDPSNFFGFLNTVCTLGVSLWYLYEFHYLNEHKCNAHFSRWMIKSLKKYVVEEHQINVNYLIIKEAIEDKD